MNSFWQRVLETCLSKLLAADWPVIIAEVRAIAFADLTGAEKREFVFDSVRKLGTQGASWLVRAGIEIAVGQMKRDMQ